jgi:hypothetical protein
VNGEIGVDIEIADGGYGVFLRDREPHAHGFGALWHLHGEFIFDLKRRLARLHGLRKIAAEGEGGNSCHYAGDHAAENQVFDCGALRIHDCLRGEKSASCDECDGYS